MKRILALVLVFSIFLGTFSGCSWFKGKEAQPTEEPAVATDPTETTPEVDEKLDKALEYLRVFYKNAAEKTPMDYKRLGQVRIGTSVYDIVWSVDVDETLIKIVENADGSVTIDINEEAIAALTEPIPYELTATLTGTDGREASLTWKHVIPAVIDEEAIEIVKAAYELRPGQSLEGTHTLTGVIISIDTMYDPGYKNITVTIEVPGAEDMPIKCYRLKGEGADTLAVGDTITVTGTLTNYNGEIEFAQGCILEAVESGGGEPPKAPEDPVEILKAAFALKPGKSLPYACTLTGTITSVDYAYDANYGNITVTMATNGYPVKCYRLKGAGVDQLNVNDVITVYGVLTNYYGTIEFGAGCQLVGLVNKEPPYEAPDPAANSTLSIAEAVAVGQKKQHNNYTAGKYYITGTITEVYNTTYGNMYITDGNATILIYGTWSENGTVRYDGLTKKPVAGDKVTLYGVIGQYGGKAQMKNGWIVAHTPAGGEGEEEEPNVPVITPAGELKAGTPYKFGMAQGNLDNQVYYLTGAMSGYYMATTTNANAAVDVYVEETKGGYYFYALVDGAKQYINMVVSGTHVNGVFQAAPSTVYTYDAKKGTLTANVNGAAYWFGTRNDMTYTTMGPCKVEYAGFYGKFYTASETEPEEPVVPDVPTVATPVPGTAYKFGMAQGNLDNQVYYLTGAMSGYYMATTTDANAAVDVYVEETEGGYRFYALVDGSKQYINMVVSGTYVNGAFQAAPSTVYSYNAEKGTLIADINGAAYWFGTRNDKTYTTMGPCKVEYDGFYGKFYLIGGEEEKTLEEQLAEAAELANGEYLDYVTTVEGVVSEIKYAYSEQYGNISFYVDVDGTKVYCYRVTGEGMDTLAVGDTVKVEGYLTAYNGTAQFDKTATVTIIAKAGVEEEKTLEEQLAEAAELANGEYLDYVTTVEGVVSEIKTPYSEQYGNITFYVDVDGTKVYCYRVTGEGMDTLAVGDTVKVEGYLTAYNGAAQFDKTATVTIIAKAGVEEEKTLEEQLAEAAELANGEYLDYVTTVEGVVSEIKYAYSEQYKNITFYVDVDGTKVYCYRVTGEGMDTLTVGDTVKVEGYLTAYNGTAQFDKTATVTIIAKAGVEEEKTLEEQLAEAAELANGEYLDYVTTVEGVVSEIKYAYSEQYGNISFYVDVDGTKVYCYRVTGEGMDTLAVGDTVKVEGYLTAYNGTAQFDKTATVTIIAKAGVEEEKTLEEQLAEAAELANGAYLDYVTTVEGVVSEIKYAYSEQYGNISFYVDVDGTKIYCYRVTGEGMDTLAVGDTVKVEGYLTAYNGTAQFDKTATVTIIAKAGVEEEKTLEEQLAEAAELANGEYLDYVTTVEGVVSEIKTPYSEQYGNITFYVDVDGTKVYCYRVTGEGMDTLAVGDTVKVEGYLTAYNGSAQFDKTATVTIIAKAGVEEEKTLEEQLAEAAELANGEYLDYVTTVEGVVSEIKTPYSEQYGNITFYVDVDGTKVYCYRVTGEGMDTLAVGDTVKVEGYLTAYNGSAQFDKTATVTIIAKAEVEETPGNTEVTPDPEVSSDEKLPPEDNTTGEGEEPAGEGEEPTGEVTTGEGEEPTGDTPTGEGEEPTGDAPAGEGEEPTGDAPAGEGEEPSGEDLPEDITSGNPEE